MSTLVSPRLRQLARTGTGAHAPPEAAPDEACELCGTPLAPEHRHLLDLETRQLLCACRACALLFDRPAAGGRHYRLVPRRRVALTGFDMSDATWDGLRIPVDMAYFFHSSAEGRVLAYYPSPAGPTQSLLELGVWNDVARANPILDTMEPDVEALLVDRVRGARRHWLVPIDDCYRLVALIRTHWRGFTGGREVWSEIAAFFDTLNSSSERS